MLVTKHQWKSFWQTFGPPRTDLRFTSQVTFRSSLQVEVEPFCPVRHELGELTPYTTYIVTVAAKTFLGSGPAESFTVVTRQRPPDGPPINVQIVSTHSQNVTAMWGPPLRPNGFITYSVKLYQGEYLFISAIGYF